LHPSGGRQQILSPSLDGIDGLICGTKRFAVRDIPVDQPESRKKTALSGSIFTAYSTIKTPGGMVDGADVFESRSILADGMHARLYLLRIHTDCVSVKSE
jgi:hypothetical protein